MGAAAVAAPPPPALYPKDRPSEVGGYDLRPIYPIYHFWVSRGRKAALEKAIPHDREWQGKHHWGEVVASELVHYDFGVIRVDRLERYCTGDWIEEEPAGSCEFRYRYAFVPASLSGDRELTKRILDNFRPEELTKLLTGAGWKPSQNLWMDAQLTRAFEHHTDLAAFYQPLAEFHEVRSSTCPALRSRLATFNELTLDISPNGSSYNGNEFPIHGQQTQIRLTAAASNGGRVVVEGATPLFELLQPIWNAVEECSPPSYKKEGAR